MLLPTPKSASALKNNKKRETLFNTFNCLYSLEKVETHYFCKTIKGIKGRCALLKGRVLENLQDGGGVRRGDHLPPQKYVRNTSTCGTTHTEHHLNAGRRPQTSQKARNSPRTWPCGWQGLGALARCQVWASEVREPNSGHWSTRDFLVPHNNNWRELSQRSPSQH